MLTCKQDDCSYYEKCTVADIQQCQSYNIFSGIDQVIENWLLGNDEFVDEYFDEKYNDEKNNSLDEENGGID